MYYQNISAALAHTRTVKNPFMFYLQHMKYREKAPPKNPNVLSALHTIIIPARVMYRQTVNVCCAFGD